MPNLQTFSSQDVCLFVRESENPKFGLNLVFCSKIKTKTTFFKYENVRLCIHMSKMSVCISVCPDVLNSIQKRSVCASRSPDVRIRTFFSEKEKF